MFWIGFGVGAIIGGSITFCIMALCVAAKRGDKNENNHG